MNFSHFSAFGTLIIFSWYILNNISKINTSLKKSSKSIQFTILSNLIAVHFVSFMTISKQQTTENDA